MKNFDFSIIRTLRQKRGITAEELADRAGITRATVAKIESGDGNPTISTLDAISGVFQLTPSDLVRMAETAVCEIAAAGPLDMDQLDGTRIQFSNFEIYVVRGKAGVRKASEPLRHENTAEICVVLAGQIRLTVAGQTYDLKPGTALRFKALHNHVIDIIEDAEFLLIHHNLA